MHPTDNAQPDKNKTDKNTGHDDDIHFSHTAACDQIRNDPESIAKLCLVCAVISGTTPVDGHRFEQCTPPLNQDLLKTHTKGFSSLVMCGCNMTDGTAVEETNAVTFEDSTESNASVKTDCESPPETTNWDFHWGHS